MMFWYLEVVLEWVLLKFGEGGRFEREKECVRVCGRGKIIGHRRYLIAKWE